MIPSTRALAKQLGSPRYNTGKPCSRGHSADRQTSNGTCFECAAIQKAVYYQKNPEARKSHNAKYYKANSEYVGGLNLLWRKQHGKELNEIRQKYYEANKGKYLAAARYRKSWIKKATPPWADLEKIEDVYETARRLTIETGVLHHVDHEVPLRGMNVCGLHVHYNLKPIPASDNLKKRNSHE